MYIIIFIFIYLHSHIFTILSTEDDTITKYLELEAIDVTKWLCASIIFLVHFPDANSHILIDLSSEHEYKYFPE